METWRGGDKEPHDNNLVDSGCPLGASAEKGGTVRPLRPYVSWVVFFIKHVLAL
jgi:hypothetical protein